MLRNGIDVRSLRIAGRAIQRMVGGTVVVVHRGGLRCIVRVAGRSVVEGLAVLAAERGARRGGAGAQPRAHAGAPARGVRRGVQRGRGVVGLSSAGGHVVVRAGGDLVRGGGGAGMTAL